MKQNPKVDYTVEALVNLRALPRSSVMQPQQDETAFNWIRDGRGVVTAPENGNRLSPDWPVVRVAHLVPAIFEAYARILHRVDANYEDIDHPLSPSENAILNIRSCEPLRSFVEQRRAEGKAPRIRWRELADLLNLPFVPEINYQWYRKKLEDGWCLSRFLRGPSDGDRQAEWAELNSMLISCTQSKECFFLFSHIPFYPLEDEKLPRFFRGTLNEVGSLPTDGPYHGGPEYRWPSDKSWCVCRDYDLEETVVGGPRKLISSLLMSSLLECLEVTAATRIDPFVPAP